MPQSRLEGKTALVVGGGQTPGLTVGNGRATAILFAREGASVVVADRDLDSAQETATMIRAEGGTAIAAEVDVAEENSIKSMVDRAVQELGRIDILHNNVGVLQSVAGAPFQDALITDIEWDAFQRMMTVNLMGMVFTCKHVIPVMRENGGGSIVSIGSLASQVNHPYIAYKTSKAGVIVMTHNIAIRYAEFGIRANVILPGLMETPQGVENRVGIEGPNRDEVVEVRNSRVPLRHKMGTAWDVAYAALYLASDEAGFVTGATILVDGGMSLNVAP